MLAIAGLLAAVASYAATLSSPYTFSAGQTISSSAMNANFDFLEKTMARGYILSGSSNYITGTSSAYQQLMSYSFTAPYSGYVIVQASVNYVTIYHPDTANTQYAYIGIGTSTNSFGSFNYNYTPTTGTPTSQYWSPNVQYQMSVSEGSSYTVYLNAYSSLGSSTSNYYYVYAPRMTVMYFPTYL